MAPFGHQQRYFAAAHLADLGRCGGGAGRTIPLPEVAYEIQHQAGNRHIEAAVRDRQSPRVTDLEQSGRGAIVALTSLLHSLS